METGGSLTAPESVRKLQTALHAKAKESPDFRFYALSDKVWRADFLQAAWHAVRRNGGAAGVDGASRYRRPECGLPHPPTASAPQSNSFRGSIPGPHVPLSTLHPRPRGRRRMTRGRRGSLALRPSTRVGPLHHDASRCSGAGQQPVGGRVRIRASGHPRAGEDAAAPHHGDDDHAGDGPGTHPGRPA